MDGLTAALAAGAETRATALAADGSTAASLRVNPAIRLSPFADDPAGRFVCTLKDQHGGVQRLLIGAELQLLLARALASADGSAGLQALHQHPQTLRRLCALRIVLDQQDADLAAPRQAQRPSYMGFMLRLLSPAVVERLTLPLRGLFAPVPFACGVLLGMAALLALPWLLSHAELPATLHSRGLLWLLLLGLAGVLLHELGHAAAAHRQGVGGVALGVGWYVCFPVAWADLSEAWTLPRRARMQIDLAGVYMQGLYLALLLLAHAITGAWPWLLAGTATAMSMLWNLNPLLRMDGYWLLCDCFGRPSLRANALQAANRLLLGGLRRLGLWSAAHTAGPQSVAGNDRASYWLVGYGVACMLFMGYVLVAAALYLHAAGQTLLPAYLQQLLAVPLAWSHWEDLLVIGGALCWKLVLLVALTRLLGGRLLALLQWLAGRRRARTPT